MSKSHLVSLVDWSRKEIEDVLALASSVKAEPERYRQALAGKTLAMIFQKSSTRTRVSFEVGMYQLGGHALFLSGRDIQLGRGETISDTAQVLSRYVDLIMARVFAQSDIDALADAASVPVINGLSDDYHPCQALTDYFTLTEVFGPNLEGRKLAYVGDGNNMAHSLLLAGVKLGMTVAIAAPEGYSPQDSVVATARGVGGDRVVITTSPEEAVAGADAVYTDVWASMGQEDEQDKRVRDFAGFCVDDALMAKANDDAVFMHCLPAHRGEEVSASVCDGPQSVIFDEAENRLHAQKALMLYLTGHA